MKVYLFSLKLTTIFLIFSILSGCTAPNTEKLTIAISKESSAYTQWLKRNNDQISTKNLYGTSIDSAAYWLSQCQGVLLTGGKDVYPGYYQQESDTGRCGSFDHYRDSLEMAVIDFAIHHKMPILGVCRGGQILNVALGGSLIIDIPQDFGATVIHRQKDWQRCFHPVSAVAESILIEITGADRDNVTSNHHQAINRLADSLIVCAYSDDDLPEAITWKNPKNKGFLFAVQWHPERMKPGHAYSDPLAIRFLDEAKAFALKENSF